MGATANSAGTANWRPARRRRGRCCRRRRHPAIAPTPSAMLPIVGTGDSASRASRRARERRLALDRRDQLLTHQPDLRWGAEPRHHHKVVTRCPRGCVPTPTARSQAIAGRAHRPSSTAARPIGATMVTVAGVQPFGGRSPRRIHPPRPGRSAPATTVRRQRVRHRR